MKEKQENNNNKSNTMKDKHEYHLGLSQMKISK